MISSATGGFALTTFPGDAQAGLRFADFVTDGTVVVRNRGRAPGRFTLRQEIGFESPSTDDGRASAQVGLLIVDDTREDRPRELYRGTVAGFAPVSVGRIPSGARREYSFRLVPRAPLRRSSLDLTYRWVAGDADPPPPDRPAEPAKPDRPKLGVSLRIPPEQRVLDTRRIVAFADCTEPCRVVATAILRGASRRPIRLEAGAPGPARAKRRTRLELRAGRPAFAVIRTALTKGPPVAVVLRVGAAAPDGRSATTSERIRLKPVPDGARRRP